MQLHKRSILITGANRGIGKAFAIEAAKNNMQLHLLVREIPDGFEQKLLDYGAQSIRIWKVDLNEPKEIESFLINFTSYVTHLDVLINNAGVLTGGLIENQTVDEINRVIQVNLTAVILLTKGLLGILKNSEKAVIVNNASVSGFMYFPCSTTYSATKAGVVAFTTALKRELVGTKISTLLLVTPGVKTRMYKQIFNLYADNLKLELPSTITAEDWAKKVFSSLKYNKNTVLPSGASYLGLKLNQFFPSLFEKVVQTKFHR
jgi:hypothetical protein